MTRQSLRRLALAAGLGLGMAAGSPAAALQCTVTMFFDFGSAELSAANRAVLDKIARDYSRAFVSVVGYGDAPGSEFDNLVISRKRAEAVSSYLEQRGTRRLLITAGHAQLNLKVADHGPNRMNRRAEIYVSPCTPSVFAGS